MISLALTLKFALPILVVCEIKFVLLIFVKIVLLHGLVYRFIVDNKDIQIIDKVGSVRWRNGEASGKSKVISTCSNDILAKIYSAVICRINALLYGVKLSTEFIDAFGCQ